MWFTPQQIKTKALTKLVQNNRNRVEKELASILLSVIEKFDLEEVNLCPLDALLALNRTRVKTDLTQLRRLLKRDWKLINQDNSNSYQKIVIWTDGDINLLDAKGRYFTVQKSFLVKNFDDTMTD
jgi:CRISPR/Cas system CSM-associated protein Csm2 small subunit